MDAHEHVLDLLAARHPVDDFGLCEYGAGGRDLDRVLSVEGQRPQFAQRNVERKRARPEEPSGAGGTLIVHAKVEDLPLGTNPDGFSVLTADVEHRPRLREQVLTAPRVAADLRHLRVAERDSVPAIAGADHEIDLLTFRAGVLQR